MANPKRIIIFSLLGLLVVVVVAITLRFKDQREPGYEGRSLSSWLEDFGNYGTDENSPPAIAIKKMGTNSIPFLLNILSCEEPSSEKPSSPFVEMNYKRKVEAAYALNVLGSNAEPAFPVLTNLLYTKNCTAAAIALAGMGNKAIPPLMQAITNQNFAISYGALGGLGYSRADPEVVVPILIQILRTSDESLMRSAAAYSLGLLHKQASLAVPALIESFKDTNAINRGTTVIALGEFGSEAQEAIPLLLEAMKDEDPTVRTLAEESLQRVAPEHMDKIETDSE